jgi:hypothetical protein
MSFSMQSRAEKRRVSRPHRKSPAVVDDDWPPGSPPGIVARYGGPGAAVEGGRRTVLAF